MVMDGNGRQRLAVHVATLATSVSELHADVHRHALRVDELAELIAEYRAVSHRCIGANLQLSSSLRSLRAETERLRSLTGRSRRS